MPYCNGCGCPHTDAEPCGRTQRLHDSDGAATTTQHPEAVMTEDPFCTHRWEPDSPIVGLHQCRRWANHDGPHRCCCNQEDNRPVPGVPSFYNGMRDD